ncbi:MAG: T9SS type A sorting domain-containing protein [Muribaculaceae bacterium]|nr:T9SS type A sorting domain-containing protein [Muribaculaceae bacterium]
MKRIFIILGCLLSLGASIASGQTIENEIEVTVPSLPLPVNEQLFPMPEYRLVDGGSKFTTSYSEDCPEELRGAFEYAVKIWEENLPECLPISIKVLTAPLGKDVPSKVKYRTLSFSRQNNNQFLYPTSAVKAILIREFNRNVVQRFHDELNDVSVIERDDDITITYNSDMFEDFSFSLDEGLVGNRFDFVTLALRDIAKGLGLVPNFAVNLQTRTLAKVPSPSTPYTERLWEALLHPPTERATTSDDGSVAFSNATKGDYYKADVNMWVLKYYAPASWIDGLSATTFIPESNNPLTQLLSYDFGRGTVMRNISSESWSDLFWRLLEWNNDVITSSPEAGKISTNGSTLNELPFEGSFTIGENLQNDNMYSDWISIESLCAGNPLEKASVDNKRMSVATSQDYSESYCEPYSYWIPNLKGEATTVSALLKNGKWDVVYSSYQDKGPDDLGYEGPQSITVSMDDLKHHYDLEEYARSTSGGLRYRIASGEKRINYKNKAYYNYNISYYTRAYIPQSARIKYSGYYKPANLSSGAEASKQARVKISQDDIDEDFIDIPIGISNVEGTDFIVIVQYDPGEDLPFTYDEYDLKKGYFIANVYREGTTKLYVISYNKNGSSRSNTIEINGVGYPDMQVSMRREGNNVQFTGFNSVAKAGVLKCKVIDAMTANNVMDVVLDSTDSISLDSLEKGVYILRLSDGKSDISSFKVIK